MTDESGFELKITNMSKIEKAIIANGSNRAEVKLNQDRLDGNEHNLRYRTGWDFNDACETSLTDEKINIVIDSKAGIGLDWEEVTRELANEVVREYVQNILADKKIQPLYRGKAKDIIEVREYKA